MGFNKKDFHLDLRKCTAPEEYIWVNSGYSTCAPMPDCVMGVKGCFSPPLAAGDTQVSFELEVNGHMIGDTGDRGKNDCGLLFAGAEWNPDKIVRKGTYHYVVEDKLISFRVVSELVPLTGKAGWISRLCIHNRSEERARIRIYPQMAGGHPSWVALDQWGFTPPGAFAENVCQTGENIWENREVRITLLTDTEVQTDLEGGADGEFRFAVIFTHAGTEAGNERCLLQWQEETSRVWEKRLELADKNIPQLKSNIPGLEQYYLKSLMSGLVCLWEKEEYVVRPFPATSGMDGGSICCYPWDVAGYSAQMLVLLLGGKTKEFLRCMLNSDIDSHITMSLDGSGLGGCFYSYSMWSIVNLFWTIITMTGEGFELFDDVIRIFCKEENRLEEEGHLKNYGRQHNLLEMRSCGYEYFVPSPNAERAWCYDRLADIGTCLGRSGYEEWHQKADEIRRAIREKLWEDQKGWFRCIHPDGHSEWVYTIQMYDVLRMGACTPDMERALLKQLHDGAFLGKYGVSSISAEDEIHYEVNDPDWSGGGCYSGDGPVLAETLWKCGQPQLAWDVLRRHFWMGEVLPYFPQEHYCDRPFMPKNKRANIIAGTAGLQAILAGMAGWEQKLDGSVILHPNPPEDGYVEIKGLNCHGSKLDLMMQPGTMRISLNDVTLYSGEPAEIMIRKTEAGIELLKDGSIPV